MVDLNRFKMRPVYVDNVLYFADALHKVYMLKENPEHSYIIWDLKDDKIIENPTTYQTLYGLLNFLAYDNVCNPYKKGHYKLSDVDLFFQFKNDITLLKKNSIKADNMVYLWSISDRDGSKQQAFKNAIYDILIDLQNNEEFTR